MITSLNCKVQMTTLTEGSLLLMQMLHWPQVLYYTLNLITISWKASTDDLYLFLSPTKPINFYHFCNSVITELKEAIDSVLKPFFLNLTCLNENLGLILVQQSSQLIFLLKSQIATNPKILFAHSRNKLLFSIPVKIVSKDCLQFYIRKKN